LFVEAGDGCGLVFELFEQGHQLRQHEEIAETPGGGHDLQRPAPAGDRDVCVHELAETG
jgi:hypothetical protein